MRAFCLAFWTPFQLCSAWWNFFAGCPKVMFDTVDTVSYVFMHKIGTVLEKTFSIFSMPKNRMAGPFKSLVRHRRIKNHAT